MFRLKSMVSPMLLWVFLAIRVIWKNIELTLIEFISFVKREISLIIKSVPKLVILSTTPLSTPLKNSLKFIPKSKGSKQKIKSLPMCWRKKMNSGSSQVQTPIKKYNKRNVVESFYLFVCSFIYFHSWNLILID